MCTCGWILYNFWNGQNKTKAERFILKLFLFGSLLHRVVEPDSVVKEPDTPELMDSDGEDSDSELYSKNTTHLNILHVECSDTDNESDQKRTKFLSWD